MPRERINYPAIRTITPLRDDEGNPDGWAQGWDQPGIPIDEGTTREPSAVLSVAWTSSKHDGDDGTPDGGYMQFVMDVSEDEVLRAADRIRKNRLIEIDPDTVPEDTVLAQVEYFPATVQFESVALSRRDAQKMIATTRRARNAVFGVDE
jgi:hypothetical protein